MKTKINLLEKIKESNIPEFPFKDAELLDIVKNTDISLFPEELKYYEPIKTNIFKKLMQSKKGVITMGLISLLFVSIFSVLTFQNSDFKNQNNYSLFDKKTPSIAQNNNLANENIQNDKKEQQNQERINHDEISSEKKEEVNSSNILEILRQNEEIKNKIEFPFIILSENELKKLGIKRNEKGLEFKTEMAYTSDVNKSIANKLIEKKYSLNSIALKEIKLNNIGEVFSEDFVDYTGWNNKNPKGIYPIYYICRNDSVGIHTSNTLDRAILSKEMDKYIRLGLTEFANQIIHLMIKVSEISIDNRLLYVETDLDSYPLLKQFIPIYIKNEGESFDYAYVIWFPNTKQLLSLLPPEYSKFYLKYSSDGGLLVPNKETMEMADKLVQMSPKKIENKIIPQYEKLFLSPEEMDKIGIASKDNKLEVTFEQKALLKDAPKNAKAYLARLKYDTTLSQIHFRFNKSIDTCDIKGTPIFYSGWDNINYCRTFPVCITLHNWIQSRNKEKIGERLIVADSERSPILDSCERNVDIIEIESDTFQVKIDRLIPVRINLGAKKDTLKMAENETNNYSEVDIWFYANREFVNLLPERYKDKLLKELELIDNVEDGLITTEQACEILKGESFFNFCGKSNESIKKLAVFPNPLQGNELNVKFDLIKDSEISIDLYDLEGKLVQNLLQNTLFTKGVFSRKFTINVANGIYIIDIKSNSGSLNYKIMKY